jgi:hypothetical protein
MFLIFTIRVSERRSVVEWGFLVYLSKWRVETGKWVESSSIKRINLFLVIFPLGNRVDREEGNKLSRTVAFSSSDSVSESLLLLCALGAREGIEPSES